jgi:SOS response regulatory protein OraA/RecX
MLTLTNIKASRIPNRVNLSFSDDSYLPFFVDDVVKLSLGKNQPIDEIKLNQIISASSFYLGKEYALRQVAISPKTQKIISQKLKLFFFRIGHKYKHFFKLKFDSTISSIIDDLNSRNLLNQSDFIKSFIAKNYHKSANQIKFLLLQKGVDVSSLKLDKTNDIDSIKRILAKKRISFELLKDFKAKNKLYASLFRQGFDISDIKAAIDDYLAIQ